MIAHSYWWTKKFHFATEFGIIWQSCLKYFGAKSETVVGGDMQKRKSLNCCGTIQRTSWLMTEIREHRSMFEHSSKLQHIQYRAILKCLSVLENTSTPVQGSCAGDWQSRHLHRQRRCTKMPSPWKKDKRNERDAFLKFEETSESGHTEAAKELTERYLHGRGCERSRESCRARRLQIEV